MPERTSIKRTRLFLLDTAGLAGQVADHMLDSPDRWRVAQHCLHDPIEGEWLSLLF